MALFLFNQAELAYISYGSGAETLLAFHGFGQDKTVLEAFISKWQHKYTIYSFDLFFHGESKWLSNNPVLEDDLKQLLKAFLKEKKILFFDVLGFSMGARFAQVLLLNFPTQIKNAYLVAPDGIRFNFWNKTAVSTLFMRWLFNKICISPNLFLKIVKIAEKIKIVDYKILKFAASQMNTFEKRNQVYLSWVQFRKLHFSIKKLANSCNSNSIKIHFIIGKQDNVINLTQIKPFTSKLLHYELVLLNSRHSNLLEMYANHL